MRAQKIYENIRFERGEDPLKNLSISKEELKRKLIEETDWDRDFKPENIVEVFEYGGFPIAIIKKTWISSYKPPSIEYGAVSHKDVTYFNQNRFKWYKTPGGAKRDIQKRIDYLNELRRIGTKSRFARSLKESTNFERGMDPKEAMGIGINAKVLNFLKWVRADYQFNPDDANYMGYLNVSDWGIVDSATEIKEGFRLFVRDWRKYLGIMDRMGLYLMDPPDLDETIFYDEDNPAPGFEAIRESQNFERGKDPLDAMDIGQKAMLKERADKIIWDWYPDPDDIEEVLGLETWEGINKYNIKISKLTDRDGNTAYYAVSDTGEPYIDSPSFYETPGEALHFEKISLKEFDREQGLEPYNDSSNEDFYQ